MKTKLFNFRCDIEMLVKAEDFAKAYGMSLSQFVRTAIDDKMNVENGVDRGESIPLSAMREVLRAANVPEGMDPLSRLPKTVLAKHEYAERLRQCLAVANRYIKGVERPKARAWAKVFVFEGALRIILPSSAQLKWPFNSFAFMTGDNNRVAISYERPQGRRIVINNSPGITSAIILPLGGVSYEHLAITRQTIPCEELEDGFSVERKHLREAGVDVDMFLEREPF